ncbi:MAG: (d)CMP kinase [Thermoanaerobaculia bacterium]
MTTDQPLIVAIDGPSGVGKSTVARRLAARLGLPHLETGAMYRALGLKVLEQGIDTEDRQRVEAQAAELDLRLKLGNGGEVEVLLDGEPLGERIRTREVSEVTSRIAVYPAVRQRMVELQRAFAARHGAVLEGRDIGTRVFPTTPFKFYLSASLERRIERRFQQLRSSQPALTRDDVAAEVAQRDHRDITRRDSPLTLDSSYTEIDTGDLTVDQVVEKMARKIAEVAG